MDKIKKILKNRWFWGLTAFVVMVINILLSIFCDWNSNIFTAISGWVSGVATAVLGGIALWQNKQHAKDIKISDNKRRAEIDTYNATILTLQKDLKLLTEVVAKSTKTLEKIEEIKYIPCFEECSHRFINLTHENYKEIIEDERIVICKVFYNIAQTFDKKDLEKLFREYHAMAFGFKNIGEKTIRNFGCYDLIFDKPQMCFIQSDQVDIKSDDYIYVVVFSKIKLTHKQEININMKFGMNNLLNEFFSIEVDIINLITTEDNIDCNFLFSPIFPCNKNDYINKIAEEKLKWIN